MYSETDLNCQKCRYAVINICTLKTNSEKWAFFFL